MNNRAIHHIKIWRVICVALVYICFHSLSSIATTLQENGCRIELRNNFSSGGFYYHKDGNTYLLAHYSDSRFDDTTDVHKINSCERIASGVTKESQFANTLTSKGFSNKSVGIKQGRLENFQGGDQYMVTLQSPSSSSLKIWTNNFESRDKLPVEVKEAVAQACKIEWDGASNRNSISLNLSKLEANARICAPEVKESRLAIVRFDQNAQRVDLAKAITWKQLENFIQIFNQNDHANLVPEARSRLIAMREKEIIAMNALSMDQLEAYYEKDEAELTSEMRLLARQRLLNESLREGTFAGILRVYRVTKDMSYVAKGQSLATSPEDLLSLEQLAVQHTVAPSRFFDVKFNPRIGNPSRSESTHMGFFALYSLFGHLPISGTIELRRASNAPAQLSLGSYKVSIEIVVNYDEEIVGRTSKSPRQMNKLVTLVINPAAMAASANVDFQLQAAMFKRGAGFGSNEQEYIVSDPVVSWKVSKIEVM